MPERSTSRVLRRLLVGLAIASLGCHQIVSTELENLPGAFHPIMEGYPETDVSCAPFAETEPAPRTIKNYQNAEPWNLSLQETLAIAMGNNPRIAALGTQPGEVGTAIAAHQAMFDPVINIAESYTYYNQQEFNPIYLSIIEPGADAFTLDVIGNLFGPELTPRNITSGAATNPNQPINPGFGLFAYGKRFSHGGIGTLHYDLNYRDFGPLNQNLFIINPAYQTSMLAKIEQPLAQGFGKKFNEASILIARSNQAQALGDFEAQVQQLSLDVMQTYWSLYLAQQVTRVRHASLKQSQSTLRSEQRRLKTGVGSTASVALALKRFETFRALHLEAINQVLTIELTLRELMGITPTDGRRIVPVDRPQEAEFAPDWTIALEETMNFRSDVRAQRHAIRAAELDLFRERNGLKPDLTASAAIATTGADSSLSQANGSMFDFRYLDAFASIAYSRPLGERAARAAVRRAQLALSRARHELRARELSARHDVAMAYKEIVTSYQLIEVQRARRDASRDSFEDQQRLYDRGLSTLDMLLDAQVELVDAENQLIKAQVDYNLALLRYSHAKGTILSDHGVTMAEELFASESVGLCQKLHAHFGRKSMPMAAMPSATVAPEDVIVPVTHQESVVPAQETLAHEEVIVDAPPAIAEQAASDSAEGLLAPAPIVETGVLRIDP
ncbi:outer membrane channel protein [Planctomycetes bacterium Pan216]|uniref:Outer membrane channel protein n=1 Tax=Kolteria novifilia TaxID=2527975 RepID=A0A518B060_9BACT|nr:outer membrane channel protein [Planctomycetes bacterium Pan216]